MYSNNIILINRMITGLNNTKKNEKNFEALHKSMWLLFVIFHYFNKSLHNV